jgi:endonuclease/exonuclease/phosphatase (EEP) superfamily protein YafD
VKRIDYLYSLRDVECTAAQVLDTEASDHRPVLFNLTTR